MKKKFLYKVVLLSLLFISIKGSIFSQGFQKNYTAGFTKGSSVVSENNGYVISGVTATGQGQNDILIMKTDLNGTVIWAKTIGGKGNDIVNRIKKTADQGYILVGSTSSYLDPSTTEDSTNIYVVKTDINGIVQWTRTISYGVNAVANDVIEKLDHTIAIVGNASSKGKTSSFILHMNPSGGIVEFYGYGYGSIASGNGIIEANNSEVFIVGAFNVYGTTDLIPYIIRVGPYGYIQRGFLFTPSSTPSTRKSFFTKINYGYDGQFIITGSEGIGNTPGFQDAQTLLMCIDSTFGVRWTRKYYLNSAESIGTSVEKTIDSGFVISGTMGVNIPVLIATDSVGKRLESKIYPGITDVKGQGWDVKTTYDGKYIFVGSRFEKTDTSIYLIQTDVKLSSNCVEENINLNDNAILTMHPQNLNFSPTLPKPFIAVDSGTVKSINPVTHLCIYTGTEDALKPEPAVVLKLSNISLDFALTSTSDVIQQISIYNLMGACVKTVDARNTKQISTIGFSSGIYIYQIVTGNHNVFNGKFAIP